MHWIDWLILLIPLGVVLFIGVKAQQHIKGVSDFLSAGRVAGRYVLAVAHVFAAWGLISIVGNFEAYYHSGFVYGFWGGFAAPISMILLLPGYCVYRFRETRALTLGQFLEIRYSRRFRIFVAILQSISGIINYAIFPAVGARFIVYFCDLPVTLDIYGWAFPTFALVMALFLFIAALVVVWNQISPWNSQGWANWFFINNIVVAGIIAVVSTVWFTIGGTIDLRRMFKRLNERERNILDDGRVIDHISADDVAMVEEIDQIEIREAHRAEEMLKKDLDAEQNKEDKL